MENASKALIMAAEILVAIMVISIGVFIFNEMGQYSAETTQDMEATQIAQFNTQFTQYYGSITTYDDAGNVESQSPIPCTIHDIVGLANLAKQVNYENGYETVENHPMGSNSDTSGYVQIAIRTSTPGDLSTSKLRNLESLTDDEMIELIKNNDTVTTAEGTDIKYFECTNIYIGTEVQTVNYMIFEEM